MKNKEINKRIRRRNQAIAILAGAAMLLVVGMLSGHRSAGIKPVSHADSDDPRIDIQSKYHELTEKISRTNVCPGITPVHIFREIDGKKFIHATGGLFAGDNMILTCGHAFWDTPGDHKVPWKFYYQILQPYEKEYHPLNRLRTVDAVETNAMSASRDVIVCIPGPAELISPLRAPQEALTGTNTRLNFKSYVDRVPVWSTVTGERFEVIGEAKVVDGPAYFVLDCSTFKSQSGTIFVSADNRVLYILSRSVVLNDELRKIFGLGKSSRGATLCSSVRLK